MVDTNIYIDNFRGFRNTTIPIRDVNFFVGENSTGKTSILSLIYLLSEPFFWLKQSFTSEYVDFKSFDDIVNKNSKNRKYFRIGIFVNEFDKRKNSSKTYATLLRFKNENDVPRLSEYNYLSFDHDVKIIFKNEDIYYRIKQIDSKSRLESKPKDFLDVWIKEEYDEKEFKKFGIKINASNLPVIFLKDLINLEILNKKSRKNLNISDYIPKLTDQMAWIAPIRTKPQNIYEAYNRGFSPEGEHIPNLLSKLYKSKNNDPNAKKIFESIESFGKLSGLFESIEVRNFGEDKNSPFELSIILDGKSYKISNVGYGISQTLPIISEVLFRNTNSWFAIQQPEVHLHPKAQASLGEFFFFESLNNEKKFIIETHSDFIIDRFRTNIRKNLNNICAQIVFFERGNEGNQIHLIDIDKKGQYSEEQPKSFKDFFIKEELLNLGF